MSRDFASAVAPEPLGAATPRPSLVFSMVYGASSFAVVSVLAYSIWAWRLVPGQTAMYVTIAAVYVSLSGLALQRLVANPAGRKRFMLSFALAFLAYATLWCAFWFGLKERYQADLWGAAVGLAVLTLVLRNAVGSGAGFWTLLLGLFLLHSAGYYLGGFLHGNVRGVPGRLLYGAAHGLGFGAGLGWVLFWCQRATPNRMAAAAVRPN